MTVDWIEVYAEARVAFPADVRLRTEDDERGGVRITAYCREFEPPLPEWMGEPDAVTGDALLVPYGDDIRAHVERIHHLSYVVRHDSPVALVTRRAVRQWRMAKAIRQVKAFAAAVARPVASP